LRGPAGGARRRPRVLLAGAFGQGNPGDESVLDAFVGALAGCDVAATCERGRGPSSGYTAVDAGDRPAVARAVLGADLVVATATVFKTLHPSAGRRPLALLANTLAMSGAARAVGRPVAFAGVGAGDLAGPGARLMARAVARSAAYVEVRDEESAAVLHAAGAGGRLQVGADVVWAAMPPRSAFVPDVPGVPAPPPGRPPRVVFALSHLAGGPSLVAALAGAAGELAGSGYEVELQPWQPERDRAMAAAVAARAGLPLRTANAPGNVADAAGALPGAALVVGLRFHSLVAAASAGVPFLAVAHEPKLSGLARRLDQGAVAPTVDGPELCLAVWQALAGPPAPAAAAEAERSAATATLTRVRALAFARVGRTSHSSSCWPGTTFGASGRNPADRTRSTPRCPTSTSPPPVPLRRACQPR
jgi:polysaccharide pyruvyl transferase WcaK-like protein